METSSARDWKPLLIFTIHKAPKLPTIRMIGEGDDVDKMIHEELGDEVLDDTLDDEDKDLGLVRMCRNEAGLQAHVHSNPEAEYHLREMISEMDGQLKMFEHLRSMGILTAEPREDGCLCGHCPPRGPKVTAPEERN